MNEEQQIVDYILGQMTEIDRVAFEQLLGQNVTLKSEVESLRNVYTVLQSSEKEVDVQLDTAFYKMLAHQKADYKSEVQKVLIANQDKHKIQKTVTLYTVLNLIKDSQIFRYAAILAGFGFMFWLGRSYSPVQIKTITIRDTTSRAVAHYGLARYNPEPVNNRITTAKIGKVYQQMATLQKEMKLTQELLILGLLQNSSPSDRLKGLDIVSKTQQPTSELVNELLKIVRSDESLNVRLSAIETLERMKAEPKIQSSFVAQLSETTEPLEQMSLITALVQMKAQESLPIIAQLEKNQTTDPNVRLLARNSISEMINEVNMKEQKNRKM